MGHRSGAPGRSQRASRLSSCFQGEIRPPGRPVPEPMVRPLARQAQQARAGRRRRLRRTCLRAGRLGRGLGRWPDAAFEARAARRPDGAASSQRQQGLHRPPGRTRNRMEPAPVSLERPRPALDGPWPARANIARRPDVGASRRAAAPRAPARRSRRASPQPRPLPLPTSSTASPASSPRGAPPRRKPFLPGGVGLGKSSPVPQSPRSPVAQSPPLQPEGDALGGRAPTVLAGAHGVRGAWRSSRARRLRARARGPPGRVRRPGRT